MFSPMKKLESRMGTANEGEEIQGKEGEGGVMDSTCHGSRGLFKGRKDHMGVKTREKRGQWGRRKSRK